MYPVWSSLDFGGLTHVLFNGSGFWGFIPSFCTHRTLVLLEPPQWFLEVQKFCVFVWFFSICESKTPWGGHCFQASDSCLAEPPLGSLETEQPIDSPHYLIYLCFRAVGRTFPVLWQCLWGEWHHGFSKATLAGQAFEWTTGAGSIAHWPSAWVGMVTGQLFCTSSGTWTLLNFWWRLSWEIIMESFKASLWGRQGWHSQGGHHLKQLICWNLQCWPHPKTCSLGYQIG